MKSPLESDLFTLNFVPSFGPVFEMAKRANLIYDLPSRLILFYWLMHFVIVQQYSNTGSFKRRKANEGLPCSKPVLEVKLLRKERRHASARAHIFWIIESLDISISPQGEGEKEGAREGSDVPSNTVHLYGWLSCSAQWKTAAFQLTVGVQGPTSKRHLFPIKTPHRRRLCLTVKLRVKGSKTCL